LYQKFEIRLKYLRYQKCQLNLKYLQFLKNRQFEMLLKCP
jgi:hypothetical protein